MLLFNGMQIMCAMHCFNRPPPGWQQATRCGVGGWRGPSSARGRNAKTVATTPPLAAYRAQHLFSWWRSNDTVRMLLLKSMKWETICEEAAQKKTFSKPTLIASFRSTVRAPGVFQNASRTVIPFCAKSSPNVGFI